MLDKGNETIESQGFSVVGGMEGLESDENYNYFQQCNEFASYNDKQGTQFEDTLKNDEGILENYNSVDGVLNSPFSREFESFFDRSTPTPVMPAPCRKNRPCYKVFKQVTPPPQSPWVRQLRKIPDLSARTALLKSEDFTSSERRRANESQFDRSSNFPKPPFVKGARVKSRNFDVHVDEENMNAITPFQECTRTNSPMLNQNDLCLVGKKPQVDGKSLGKGELWRTDSDSGRLSEEGLLPVDIMGPVWFDFFRFSHFNSMQTEAFPEIFNSDNNCVIASPFGSGKSVLQELAFVRMISNNKRGRALYLAVNQTTCIQKLNKWRHKFGKINKRIGLLGEDRYEEEVHTMLTSDIVISTAESWDNLLRVWRESQHLAGLVDLLIVDELNLISEPEGAVLEAVITRLHYMCKNIRIVATCLPFPNISDICGWLKSKDRAREACAFVFDDSYVPKHMEKKLLAFDNSREGEFHYDSVLNCQLLTIIKSNNLSSGVIIFCPSNKSCVSTAEYLALHNKLLGMRGSNLVVSDFTNNNELNYLVRQGVGFCYKGLKGVDSRKIFDLFSRGGISILCCTTSILHEENFTTPNVIIKGVKRFIKGRLIEYSRTDVWRMISTVYRNFGKSFGKVILVTDLENASFYRDLLSNELPVESSLDTRILEYILSEISLRKVCSTRDIMNWLKGTFLYRSKKINNLLESAGFQKLSPRPSYNMQMELYCSNTLKILQENGLIVSRNYNSLRVTKFGSIMYKYGLLCSTMRQLMACKSKNSTFDLLCILSELDVFNEVEVGVLEHNLLREMNSSSLLEFPLQVCEFKKSDKINLLFQLFLFGTVEKIKKNHLRFDKLYLDDIRRIQYWGPRITSCMAEIFAYKKDTCSLQNVLALKQSIYAKLNKDTLLTLIETSQHLYFDSPTYDIFEDSIHPYSGRVNFPSLLLPEQIKNCNSLDQLPGINFIANITSSEVNVKMKAIDIGFMVSIRLAKIKGSPRKIRNIIFDFFAERSDHTLVDFRKVPISILTTTVDFSFHLNAQVYDKNQNICCYLLPQRVENVSYRCLLNLNEIEDWKFHKLVHLSAKNSKSEQSENLSSSLANDRTRLSSDSVLQFEVSNINKQNVGSDEMCSNSINYAFEPYIHTTIALTPSKAEADESYKFLSNRHSGNQDEKFFLRRLAFGKKSSINKPRKLQCVLGTENKLKTALISRFSLNPINEFECEKKDDDDIVLKGNYKSDFSFSNSEMETPFENFS